MHQRAQLGMQGLKGAGGQRLQRRQAGAHLGELGFGLLAPGALGGQLLRPFGIGKGGSSGHGQGGR